MAYRDAWATGVTGDEAVRPGAAATEHSFGGRSRLIGIVMTVILFQVFLFLIYVDQSPLIPGSFAGYGNDMIFYLVIESAVALPIIGFAPGLIGSKIHVNLVTGGGVFRFMAIGSIVGFLAWALMGLALTTLHASYQMVSGSARLSGLLFLAFFVAFAEELTFRAALPLVGNWFVMSALVFASFHLVVDASTFGLADVAGVASAFIQRAIAGVVLWIIYRYVGFAAAVFSHFTYDGVLTGYLSGSFPISLAHMGLVVV